MPPLYLTNPDGSGRTSVEDIMIDDDMDGMTGFADPANRLINLGGAFFVFRPGEEKAYAINAWPYGNWHESFIRADGRSGFLAVISEGVSPVILDLVIYELPGLKVRSRVPLFICPRETPDCDTAIWDKAQRSWDSRKPVGDMYQLTWSPDGRYLAFAAIRSGTSSDLYLYDSTNGSTREMTGGPDDIGKIWWSPDGEWIIFESLSETQESLWAITLEGSQYRQLYTMERYGAGLYISDWMSNDTFLSQEGMGALDNVYDLRLVNLGSGQVTQLYEDEFHSVVFNRNTGTILLQDINNEWYWLTEAHPTLKPVSILYGYYYWDSDEQAIIKAWEPNSVCQANEVAVWTPDVIHCRPNPAMPGKPDVFASPDALWQIRVADGIWLEKASGEPVRQVGNWSDGQVIWRPDSMGFFLVAKNDPHYALYYVSVPDLALSLVDTPVGERISYQWLWADGR